MFTRCFTGTPAHALDADARRGLLALAHGARHLRVHDGVLRVTVARPGLTPDDLDATTLAWLVDAVVAVAAGIAAADAAA